MPQWWRPKGLFQGLMRDAPRVQEGRYVLTASRRLAITTVGNSNIQFISVNVTCTSKRKGLGVRGSASQEDN